MSAGEIVIVDDNPTNLTLLAGILEAAGYTVRATNSGKRVQKLVEADPPELVMLDVQMPDVDGYEVCRRLKADDATRSIPVMFISALDGVLDKVEAFNAGAVDYVTKPFHADEVIARVESQLKVFRLQRQLEERNAELQRMYEDLVAANRKAERVFSALSDVLPGTVLDDTYRLDARIGQGAFGAVFRAEHLSLQRAVAVKVLRPTADNDAPEAVERFRVEGIAACRLNHPNAVDVIDFGVSASGIAYLVMELLRGYTLGWVLKQRGLLPLDRCVEIMLPVCDVLAEAHALDILHRDVKPENVFLHQTRRGRQGRRLRPGQADARPHVGWDRRRGRDRRHAEVHGARALRQRRRVRRKRGHLQRRRDALPHAERLLAVPRAGDLHAARHRAPAPHGRAAPARRSDARPPARRRGRRDAGARPGPRRPPHGARAGGDISHRFTQMNADQKRRFSDLRSFV